MSILLVASKKLRWAVCVATVLLVSVTVVELPPLSAHVQEAGGVSLFSDEQATRGGELYGNNCAVCHGAELTGGGGAPSLQGPDFLFGWSRKTTKDLVVYVAYNMPPGQSQSLSDQEYEDITAYILSVNGYGAGKAALSPTEPKLIGEPKNTPRVQ